MAKLFYLHPDTKIPTPLPATCSGTPLSTRIARDVLEDGKVVSTIFLNTDHSLGDGCRPLHFETMVFPDEEDFRDIEFDRYHTYEEALQGHAAFVKKYRASVEDVPKILEEGR